VIRVVLAIVVVVAGSVELAVPAESITAVDVDVDGDATLPSDSDEHAANIASAPKATQRSGCQRLAVTWFTARVWHPDR
jgi:hypothetical protein